jgi:hypothetical protein
MTPLERHKGHITLISGLSFASFGDFATNRHYMGASSVLTGTPPTSGGKPGGASIDQLVATQLRAGARASLEVSVTDGGAISYTAANAPNTPVSDPRKLFERIFGGAMAPGGASSGSAVAERKLRALYLDAVRGDIESLRPRLGAHDKRRLESYLDGLHELEREVAALATLPAVTAGGACAPLPDSLKGVTEDAIKNRANAYTPISQATSKLVAAALACGHTQVFSLNFSSPNATPWFRVTPGLANNHHELGHQMHGDLPRSVGYLMERFAELLDALAAYNEGDKTLLDQTGILVTSDVARNHESHNMPTLLAGKAGGALKGGLHVKASGPTTRAGLTLARASGAQIASYGVRDASATEVIRDAMV